MQIYHVSAECYPVAKVGGLADVVGALPKYLQKAGAEAKVVMPAYDTKFVQQNAFTEVFQGELTLGWMHFRFQVFKEVNDQLGFELFLIAIPGLFDRPNVYSYQDDTERFTSFQIAFLQWLVHTNQQPDVVHCHDHHTGLVPFMMQFCYAFHPLQHVQTVLTIHNGQYQGWFDFDKMPYLPDFDRPKAGYLEWDGMINPLASAIKCVKKVTTVSQSYLYEMMEKANGLENLLKFEQYKSVGILNGIDQEVWNPKTDTRIPKNYNDSNFSKGKEANKQWLCEQFSLDASKPLFTFIGRLVWEKGADILPQSISLAMQHLSGDFNVVVLGSGDPNLEGEFRQMQQFYPNHFQAYIGYNEDLAHALYAGADFLLMPSRVEPCGLNQMYALRYGTIPIVRRTGGLRDTVIDMGDGGNGICHDQVAVFDIVHSMQRALELFHQPKEWCSIRKAAMQIDHSWERVAQEYLQLYQELKN
ncbi:MAG: glycogen synthase [Flavobacterium sp.]